MEIHTHNDFMKLMFTKDNGTQQCKKAVLKNLLEMVTVLQNLVLIMSLLLIVILLLLGSYHYPKRPRSR